MRDEILKHAYIGLLHDIGKFNQRTELASSLTEDEKRYVSFDAKEKYPYHLHAGYTYRFLKNILKTSEEIANAAASHHGKELNGAAALVKEADRIASAIDREDERYDYKEYYDENDYSHIVSRLHSIFYEIDFGKHKEDAFFPLGSLDEMHCPKAENGRLTKEVACQEYQELFQRFCDEIQKEKDSNKRPALFQFHRIYALLYKYTTVVPASTYRIQRMRVSLFDHLKLTAAIASCLKEQGEKLFYMLEFDISGIQQFIYKIVEGAQTKSHIAKSLRGRSALVSLLSNAIAYALLHEFSLTEANIIFNTGGGGIVLLPYLPDTEHRIQCVCQKIIKALYNRFDTELTFVYAYEILDDKELEEFKAVKGVLLKAKLNKVRLQKYKEVLNANHIFTKLNEKSLCRLCGKRNAVSDDKCDICNHIIQISKYYTKPKHDKFLILYDYDDVFKSKKFDLSFDFGFGKLYFLEDDVSPLLDLHHIYYVDSVNCFTFGNVKLAANLVPEEDGNILPFENIVQMQEASYGDKKLGILKMDVDNLGAVFAFGLKRKQEGSYEMQRSLSKYLTLSRFIELFFTQKLKQICLDVSRRFSSDGSNMFYINYAGGDDLVILGPVYGIVQLAEKINDEFRRYVKNENITISGGIHIQMPKKPVRFGVQWADEVLECSKNNKYQEKHAITLLGISIPFSEYGGILKQVEKYRAYVGEGMLTRTSFYRIMQCMRDSSIEAYYEAIPKIQYTLYRLVKDEQVRLDIAKDLTSARTMKEVESILLMMKLTIMFTREEK